MQANLLGLDSLPFNAIKQICITLLIFDYNFEIHLFYCILVCVVGSLPALSPSCIPSAGQSPITHFNAAFGNWETPPYSPTAAAAASYRTPFSNTGKLS